MAFMSYNHEEMQKFTENVYMGSHICNTK